MSDQEWIACNCDKCVAMCKRPCWGTPEEIKGLIDLGYAERMMNDYWASNPSDIQIISPAVVGYENGYAPWWPTGICTFLKDGLCELHNTGFKPMEGRLAIHEEHEAHVNPEKLHGKIAMKWDNDEARKLVNEWLNKWRRRK